MSELRKASIFQSWTYDRVSNQMWGSRLLIMDRIVEQQNLQEGQKHRQPILGYQDLDVLDGTRTTARFRESSIKEGVC